MNELPKSEKSNAALFAIGFRQGWKKSRRLAGGKL